MAHLIVYRAKHAALALGLLVAIGAAHASEIPDAAINPISGAVELADAVSDGEWSRIRFVELPDGSQAPGATLLSESTTNDLSPRIVVEPDGDTWVVWWRESATPEVRYRFRDLATGSWSAESRISGEGESARHPEIAQDGSTTWIVYEASVPAGTQLVVMGTDDGPEPVPPTRVIATSTFGGELDVDVHAEAGHVWISWIDSATEVAWSHYDPQAGVWSSVQSTSFAASSVASARAAIRSTVLAE